MFVPSWLVFHRMPVLGVPANLLAVPVAGFVMLYGIPAGILGAAISGPLATLVMAPAALGTRWVATVGRLAGVIQPHGTAAALVWSAHLVVLSVMWRRRPSSAQRGSTPPPAKGAAIDRPPVYDG